jgi:hypothetical protein
MEQSKICSRCKQSVPTALYRERSVAANFRFCQPCAAVFGFAPLPPEVEPTLVIEQDIEILEEQVIQKPPQDYIPNSGSVENGAKIGTLFGICGRCGVKHTDAGCPRQQKQNQTVGNADEEGRSE